MKKISWLSVCFLAIASVYSDDTSPTPMPECLSAALNGILEVGCWGYKQCVNGVLIQHYCPTGDVLDKETLKCVLKGSGHTECDKNSLCSGVSDGMYADRGDFCKSYYRCYGALNIGQFYCPASTIFNEAIQTCDYPGNVEPPCGSKPPSSTTEGVSGRK